ncbi:MAG: hypothetical protein IK099_12470 [Clostridia bacterium]|nr:hypothetical protein [Clostridia bacterium]
MYKTYQEEFLLRSCDCDFMGSWRPSAVMQTMQEIAGAHSELLGCGRSALIQQDMVWVLSRSEIHMDRYPKINDRITAETFPTATRRWFFPRYYFFRDEQGEALGYAATLWVLMNINDRRMLPPGDVARLLPENADLPLPMGLPATVDLVNGEENVLRRRPAYFDLDVNMHVNNTRYADWACDALGIEAMRKYCLETILVNFDAEVLPDQTITLHTTVNGSHFRVAGYHEEKMHFEIGGKLRERNAD